MSQLTLAGGGGQAKKRNESRVSTPSIFEGLVVEFSSGCRVVPRGNDTAALFSPSPPNFLDVYTGKIIDSQRQSIKILA
jgi:hypothetical protein